MPEKNELLERIVLGEIEGKNRAIHAYDGMVWKLRSGFLTLLFGGWAILLKGIVEAPGPPPGRYGMLVWGLFLFSPRFAFGAWCIDWSYVRRKFRVILALDRLIDETKACGSDYLKIPSELLHVAGDSAKMPYDSDGYRQAAQAEFSVYLVPLVIILGVIVLVVR